MPLTAGLGVAGVRVGHWTDSSNQTGCTVIEFPEGTVASYEARGGAPASREVELLRPDKAVTAVDAVLLTGGSAFGLAAAQGVMRFYEEAGRGVQTPAGKVPIIPALALYDLSAGSGQVRPADEHGYLAARATRGEQLTSGRIGAGTGAYAGHWRGPSGRKAAGLASHVATVGELIVAVLCAVNAFGDIDRGDGGMSPADLQRLTQPFGFASDRMHTTIGVVCTNGRFSKAECQVIAQGAHDGLARAITPPHTRFDGDAFIAAATGQVGAHVDVARFLAVTAVCQAIRSLADDGGEAAAAAPPLPGRLGRGRPQGAQAARERRSRTSGYRAASSWLSRHASITQPLVTWRVPWHSTTRRAAGVRAKIASWRYARPRARARDMSIPSTATLGST